MADPAQLEADHPRPSHAAPPWAEPYHFAVVGLATAVLAGARAPVLVFATVSLLTPDRPRPLGDHAVAVHKLSRGRGKLFFKRIVLRAPEAIAWYRGDPSAFRTPLPDAEDERDPKSDGIAIRCDPLRDELPWPILGFPVGGGSLLDEASAGFPAPFVGGVAARLHRRFAAGHELDAVLAAPAALSFLEQRLHVGLGAYHEYLGGLALVVPDPVLRRIHHFISPRPGGGGEDLVVHLEARAGASLDGLALTVVERRSNLLTRHETRPVPPDGLVVAEREQAIDLSGFTVVHPVHGVLHHQEPLPFLRQVDIAMSFANRRISLTAPLSEAPTAPEETVEFSDYADATRSLVHLHGEGPEHGRVLLAEAARRRRTRASELDQAWLDTREAAATFLRERIAHARERVWIADPSFGARQIAQFVHHVRHPSGVAVALLTSRLAFEGALAEPADDVDARANDPERRRLRAFEDGLKGLEQRNLRSLGVWVLRGKVPPLHDRFLVVDERAWFIGGSLNALGERSSLAVGVPDPGPVIDRLAAFMTAARSFTFSAYAAERPASPRTRPG